MHLDIVDTIARYITFFLVAVIFVVGVVVGYPQIMSNKSLRLQESELDEKIESKKAEIAELVDNQRRFSSDPEFLEDIARQNRRVYPGEFVFLFDK